MKTIIYILIILFILIITVLIIYKQNIKLQQSAIIDTNKIIDNNKIINSELNYSINSNIQLINTSNINININNLLINKPPWGIYLVSDWDNASTLYEARRNGRNAVTKNVKLGIYSGYGSSAFIPCLLGKTNGTILWPVGSIPLNFTICAITRYTGGANQRILQSSGTDNSNWFHGHSNNKRGVVYYGSWMTPDNNNTGIATDWVVTCGKNGSTAPNNIWTNNTQIGNNNNGIGGLQLGINVPGGGCCSNETSNWALSQVFIWDQILTDDEIKIMSNTLTQHLDDGIPLIIYNIPKIQQIPVLNSNPFMFYNLLNNKPPWGIYLASDWDGIDTLYEVSRNGRNVITKGVKSGNQIINNSDISIPYLFGDTSATMLWPVGSIPLNFTICSITRYTGGANQRILQSSGADKSNWFHGHGNNNSGVVYYNNWMTPEKNNNSVLTDWVVTCGKNGSVAPNNILANNTSIGTNNNGVGGLQLGINIPGGGCCSNETSNWAFSQVFIWDQILNDYEIKAMSNALNQYLIDGEMLTINNILKMQPMLSLA